MKKFIILLVLTVFLSVSAYGQSKNDRILSGINLVVNIDTLEFGSHCPGIPIEKQFSIRNNYTMTVKVSRLETEDTQNFSSDMDDNTNIGIGGSRNINVHFNSTEPGLYITRLDIYVYGQSEPAASVILRAEVKSSKLEFIGNGVFDNLKPGQRDTLNVKLINSGNDYAYLEKFLPLSEPFVMLEVNPQLPRKINPGDEIDIKLEYSYNSLYQDNNILKIKSIPDFGQCLDSAVMQLFGQGETFVIGLEPEFIDYGIVARCKTVLDTLRVINLEGGDFEILEPAEIIGADAQFFKIISQPTSPKMLGLQEAAEYIIEFVNIDNSTSSRQALLRLKTNDPIEKIVDIPLQGSHEGLLVEHPELIDFEEVLPYHPRQEKYSFTNNGSFELNLVEVRSSFPYVDVTPQTALINPGETIEFAVDMTITNAIEIDGVLTMVFDEPCLDSSIVNIIGKGFQGKIEHPESIDYGTVPFCESRIEEILINSTGNTSVSIKNMVISGRDESAFVFADDVDFPKELMPGGVISRSVSFDASHLSDGPKQGELVMTVEISGRDSIFTVPLNAVRISPQFEMPAYIEFGDVIAGNNSEQIITVINRTGQSVMINNTLPLSEDDYSYSPSLQNYLIEDGDKIDVTIRFAPTSHRQYFDTLRFITHLGDCITEHFIAINGKGILESSIRTENVECELGEKNVVLPFYAKINKGNITKENLSYEMVVSFDAGLYYAQSVKNARIESNKIINDKRYIKLSGEGITLNTSEILLTQIKGMSLLAENLTSDIKIESFEWSDDILVNTESGKFEAKEICQHNIRPIIAFLPTEASISPQPAHNFANVSIKTQEQGDFAVEIYSVNFALVHREAWVNKSPKIQNYDIKINTSNLADGFYFVVLQTPMGPKTYRLIVLKD